MNPIIDYIQAQLAPFYSPEEAKELAFWVLEETTGLSRAAISARKDTQNISNIEIILKRLQKKEPIQYIFGHTLWFGLDLLVNSSTLIPRPETAELVEWILAEHTDGQPLSVLDIGTGSGCIAIALKKRRPMWSVTGLDISPQALQVAQRNAQRNGVEVDWVKTDIFSDFIGTFDIIVSNPPYITETEKYSMESTVLDYEPHSALFVPDDDPLRFYRRICSMTKSFMGDKKSGLMLYFEVNGRFAQQVARLMRHNGYDNVQIKKDIYEKQRMVCGRIKN